MGAASGKHFFLMNFWTLLTSVGVMLLKEYRICMPLTAEAVRSRPLFEEKAKTVVLQLSSQQAVASSPKCQLTKVQRKSKNAVNFKKVLVGGHTCFFFLLLNRANLSVQSWWIFFFLRFCCTLIWGHRSYLSCKRFLNNHNLPKVCKPQEYYIFKGHLLKQQQNICITVKWGAVFWRPWYRACQLYTI